MNENESKNSIAPEEEIARYILQSGHFKANQSRVTYSAYMPAFNGQTSVYRISGLTEPKIWEIGQQMVADKRQLPLKGRADLIASDILDENLNIEPETVTHQLHANIIGWPEKKHKRILVAKKLAEKAEPHVNPS